MKKFAHTSSKKQVKEKINNEDLKNVSGGNTASTRRRNPNPFAPLKGGRGE